jgi:hypothetical protein
MPSPTTAAPALGSVSRPFLDALIAATAASRLLVERPQRLYYLVEVDGTLSSRQTSQCRNRLDGARIRRPRREDRSLFIERQIGIVDHLRRMLECLGRMQKCVEIASIVE